MNMKKLTVVMLCMCMLLCMGVACAEETTTCAHANTDSWTSVSNTDTTSYTAIDNAYHTINNIEIYDVVYCYDCSTTLSRVLREGVTSDQSTHSYGDDGVCYWCKHVNTCAHTNTDVNEYISGERTYEAIDNVNHYVKGELWQETYCSDCRWWMPGVKVSDSGSIEQRHDYDEAGKCEDCGHVNTCTHANTEANEYISGDRTYTPVSNKYHNVNGELWQESYCNDCKRWLPGVKVSDSGSVEEWHDYDENGKCEDCGHVNTCTHPNMNVNDYIYYEGRTYQAIDNRVHLVTGKVYRDEWCNECGWDPEDEMIAESGSEEYNHDYDGNKCVDCGHVNTCTHGNTWIDEYIEYDSRKYEPIDIKYHLVTGKLMERTYCEDCDTEVSEKVVSENGSLEETHNYEDGVCRNCKFVNTCKHPNPVTEHYIEWDGATFEAIDNGSHKITGPQWENVWCEDCYTSLSDKATGLTMSDERSHDYSDGKCRQCGHVNTCTHANLDTYYGWERVTKYEQVEGDAIWHKLIYDRYKYTYCTDCNDYETKELVKKDYVEYDMHEYTSTGKCRRCGYTDGCAHEKTYFWDGVYSEGSYVMIDALYCARETVVERYEYCAHCGINISHKEISQNDSMRMHYISNGKCTYCGYKPECAHTNTETYEDGRSLIEYTSYDAQGHTGKYVKYYTTRCIDCGNYLSGKDSDENVTLTFEHSFNDGRCSCGYASGCAHTNTYKETWVTSEYYVQKDSSKHIIYGKTREDVVCSDCGETLDSIVIDLNGSAEANHYFGNGSRCSCGYVKNGSGNVTTLNGWISAGGKWYFYENGAKVTSSWRQDSVGWVYLDANGAMMTEAWVQDSTGWCYVGANGYAVTNTWKKDSTGWVYLDANGVMVTNAWVQDAAGWCYVGADGYAVTNCWKQDSAGWCYLNSEGSMTKNSWVETDGKWYYVDENGYRVINTWKKDSVGWVYLGSDGAMVTNAWAEDSVGWCYLGADGYAVTNTWKKDSIGWCYLNSEGSMTKNAWVETDGKWYYVDENGYRVINAWTQDAAGWCYLDSEGIMVKNQWLQLGADWYYMNSYGYMVTGTVVIDGTEYVFNNDGVWVG